MADAGHREHVLLVSRVLALKEEGVASIKGGQVVDIALHFLCEAKG